MVLTKPVNVKFTPLSWKIWLPPPCAPNHRLWAPWIWIGRLGVVEVIDARSVLSTEFWTSLLVTVRFRMMLLWYDATWAPDPVLPQSYTTLWSIVTSWSPCGLPLFWKFNTQGRGEEPLELCAAMLFDIVTPTQFPRQYPHPRFPDPPATLPGKLLPSRTTLPS